MANNIYKLQRFNGTEWEDVQLGQHTNTPSPTDNTNNNNLLEEYLTLSQVQDKFLTTEALQKDSFDYSLSQPTSHAIAIGATALGKSVAGGRYSFVHGEGSEAIQTAYWDETGKRLIITDSMIRNIPIEYFDSYVISAQIKNTNTEYLLVITSVLEEEQGYAFNFSNTSGDWSSFMTQIPGIITENNQITGASLTLLTHAARGYCSMVSGRNSITYPNATNSHAFGDGLIASSLAQTVIGQYNQKSDALFVIGNGSGNTNRSNILEVSNNKIKYNTIPDIYHLKGGGLGSVVINWKDLTCELSDQWKTAKTIYAQLEFYRQDPSSDENLLSNNYQNFCFWIIKTNSTSHDAGDLIILPFDIYNGDASGDYIEQESATQTYVAVNVGNDPIQPGSGIQTYFLSNDFDHYQLIFDNKNNCVYVTRYDESKKRWYIGAPAVDTPYIKRSMTLTLYYIN